MFTDDIMLPRGTTIDLNRLQGSVLQTKSKSQLPKKSKFQFASSHSKQKVLFTFLKGAQNLDCSMLSS